MRFWPKIFRRQALFGSRVESSCHRDASENVWRPGSLARCRCAAAIRLDACQRKKELLATYCTGWPFLHVTRFRLGHCAHIRGFNSTHRFLYKMGTVVDWALLHVHVDSTGGLVWLVCNTFFCSFLLVRLLIFFILSFRFDNGDL